MTETTEFLNSAAEISANQLEGGFFEGWPDPPSPETHLRILRGSSHVVLAIDRGDDRVVGFINAVSDGVHAAYIPLLEVLPEYRGRGLGAELVRRLLAQLDRLYMIDLVCDADLERFYAPLGLRKMTAMSIRNFENQNGAPSDDA